MIILMIILITHNDYNTTNNDVNNDNDNNTNNDVNNDNGDNNTS